MNPSQNVTNELDSRSSNSNELDMDAYHEEGIEPGEHKVFDISPEIHSFNDKGMIQLAAGDDKDIQRIKIMPGLLSPSKYKPGAGVPGKDVFEGGVLGYKGVIKEAKKSGIPEDISQKAFRSLDTKIPSEDWAKLTEEQKDKLLDLRDKYLGSPNVPEILTSVAIKHPETGKIYTGTAFGKPSIKQYGIAMQNANADYPGSSLYDQNWQTGYMTNKGRFVNSYEASKMVEAAEQTKRANLPLDLRDWYSEFLENTPTKEEEFYRTDYERSYIPKPGLAKVFPENEDSLNKLREFYKNQFEGGPIEPEYPSINEVKEQQKSKFKIVPKEEKTTLQEKINNFVRDNPEYRQHPWGYSQEYIQSLSHEDYIKGLETGDWGKPPEYE